MKPATDADWRRLLARIPSLDLASIVAVLRWNDANGDWDGIGDELAREILTRVCTEAIN